MRHGATRISCRGIPERLRGFLVCERVQEGHATRKCPLSFGAACHTELDISKRSPGSVVPVLLLARNSAIRQ